MAIVEAVLLLIAACIGFALLARRLRLPYAVILVLGGMALAKLAREIDLEELRVRQVLGDGGR